MNSQHTVVGTVPPEVVTSPLLLPQILGNPGTSFMAMVVILRAPGMEAQSPPMVPDPEVPYWQHMLC